MIEGKVLSGIEDLDKMIGGFPRGSLVTIAGNPGTGKTALSAKFIYNGIVRYGEPGVYASLIEDEGRFYQFMKGLGLDFKPLKEKGLFQYIAIPTLFEPGVSESISEILDTVESINAKRLVIDSFTAIRQMLKKPAEARILLHSLLSRIARQLECTTFLIKEIPGEKHEYSYEEFVSDVVLLLYKGFFMDKFFREIRIVKARGSEVKEYNACVSLYKGFNVYAPTKTLSISDLSGRTYEPPADLPGCYTTGISDLDSEIGGYPAGSTILYEVEKEVTDQDRFIITIPHIVSYILKERPVIIIPPTGVELIDIDKLREIYGVPSKIFNTYMRIIVDVGKEEKLPLNVKKLEFFHPGEVIKEIEEICEDFSSRGAGPPLVVLGVDRLAYHFKEGLLDVVFTISNFVKNMGGLTSFIVKPIYPWIIERISPIANIHWKIAKKYDRTLLLGLKPSTPIYIVDLPKGSLEPRLIPVI